MDEAPLSRRLRQIRALILKEALETTRDPSTFGIAFVLPLLLLMLFGFAVTLDLQHVPIAVVPDKSGVAHRDLIARLEGSRYLDAVLVPSMEQAIELLKKGEVFGILRTRTTLAREVRGGHVNGSVQLIVRGTDSNTARLTVAYVTAALARELGTVPLLQWEPRFWFNSEVNSRYQFVPGTLAVILTIIGVMLTALVIAREYELGTFEKIRATPVGPVELALARILPYFTYGIAGAAVTFLVATNVFDVPFRGSYAVLILAVTLYLIVWLSVGVIVSGLAKSQFVSAQVTIILGFLPSFMLSGFIFEIRSMPVWLQVATYIFPPRYMVALVQTLFLAGTVPQVVWSNITVLAAMAVITAAVAGLVVRRNLRTTLS